MCITIVSHRHYGITIVIISHPFTVLQMGFVKPNIIIFQWKMWILNEFFFFSIKFTINVLRYLRVKQY